MARHQAEGGQGQDDDAAHATGVAHGVRLVLRVDGRGVGAATTSSTLTALTPVQFRHLTPTPVSTMQSAQMGSHMRCRWRREAAGGA